MDIEAEIKDIKRMKAMDECFAGKYFNVCPINRIHPLTGYPNRETLNLAHIIYFEKMTDEMIVELKSLAREAIYYERPWWRIF